MKTETEIEKKYDELEAVLDVPSRYPGMSYEEGIQMTLEWILEIDGIQCPIKGE